MVRVSKKEDMYGIEGSLLSWFRNLKVERKENLLKVKLSLIRLGSETGLKQLACSLR
jgi:hypothetical protein